MRDYLKPAILIIVILFSCSAGTGNCFQAPANGVRDDGPRFRISRSISGSKGSQQFGRFVVDDPRSVFSVPQDRQVIVYFELEGPTGMHRIEGFWKNPSGKVVTISDYNYESREKRFSAYWTLALSESAETGTWTLEARVDGEYVGAFTFQIVANAPADVVLKKKMLGPSEAYQRALASTVIIEKLGKDGRLLGISSGFLMTPTVLLSVFRTVDGASKTRLIFPDGRIQETDQILDWSRRQDWAAIKIEAGLAHMLPVAEKSSGDIGDVVTYLEVAPAGNRVLSEAKIVGRHAFPSTGDRLNLSQSATEKAIGSPLMNEYGEVIGMLAGSLYPGRNPGNLSDTFTSDMLRAYDGTSGSTVIPINSVTLKQTTPVAMETLIQNGESLPPIISGRYVTYVQLAHRIDKSGSNPWPADPSTQFTRRDTKMAVFVMWNSKEEIQGRANLQVYSRENKLLLIPGKIKEVKVNLKPGRSISTYWQLDLSSLAVGIYRVDILFNGEPASRNIFQIVN
jgi:S1-C subfamily serine protease